MHKEDRDTLAAKMKAAFPYRVEMKPVVVLELLSQIDELEDNLGAALEAAEAAERALNVASAFGHRVEAEEWTELSRGTMHRLADLGRKVVRHCVSALNKRKDKE